ncbi:TetR/AcrR family transcriptional regulator [Candidatus Aminicenantes bacterium AC-334-K16]|jgi:AcrR family transcriptional regulator|nr:TetR/AcrR family transcriptional regulator [Candidatus Aminicenantes bacterium AC-334-K16]
MKKSIFDLEEPSRKKEIVDACLRIMDSFGIKGLTVARIAQEVGFSESALYRHFKSKNEIVLFILKETGLMAQHQFQEVLDSTRDSRHRLENLLQIHLQFLEEYPGLFRIIYSDEIHIGESYLLEKLGEIVNQLIGFIQQIVDEGKKIGEIKPEVDSSLAAVHFLGIVETVFTYWTIKKRKISLRQAGLSLLRQLFAGIAVDQESKMAH